MQENRGINNNPAAGLPAGGLMAGLEGERDTRAALRDTLQALEDLYDALPGSVGTEVLIFRDHLDLVPLAVRWGWAVAVDLDGPEVEALRVLLTQMRTQGLALGRYALGKAETAEFLTESDRPILVTDRRQAFQLLELRWDDLPAAVAYVRDTTAEFLRLATERAA